MGQVPGILAKLLLKAIDTYRFAPLAGTPAPLGLQILISNYSIPADFKLGNSYMTPHDLKAFGKIMAKYAEG